MTASMTNFIDHIVSHLGELVALILLFSISATSAKILNVLNGILSRMPDVTDEHRAIQICEAVNNIDYKIIALDAIAMNVSDIEVQLRSIEAEAKGLSEIAEKRLSEIEASLHSISLRN